MSEDDPVGIIPHEIVPDSGSFEVERGRQLRRPYFSTAEETCSTRLHFGHWNMWRIASSLASNSDRDQAIGRWQDSQVGGPSSRSIDRLSASIGAPFSPRNTLSLL
jgi:hypothetical protein